jgi:hypothetical protein
MTLDKNKELNSEYAGLESFFPLLYNDSELKERNDQVKQKSKPGRKGTIINKTILIQRRNSNSDIWICNSCTLTGDRWFMEKHSCKQNVTNNFAKSSTTFSGVVLRQLMTFTNTSSNEIKVNPEYYKIVNPLSNIEYESLNKSIKVDGLHYPIVINSK